MPNDAPPHELTDPAAVAVIVHPPERRRGRSSAPAQAGHCCCCCCCCCLHSLGSLIGAIVGPNLGKGYKRLSSLSLTHYWDEEYSPRLEAREATGAATTRERDAIRAAPPVPPARPGQEAITDQPRLPPARREQEAIRAEGPISAATPAGPLRSYESERRLGVTGNGPSAVSLFWWTVLVAVLAGMFVLPMLFGLEPNPLYGGLIVLLVFPALQLGAAVVAFFILLASDRPDRGYQLAQLGKIVLGMVVGAGLGILAMVALFMVFVR